MVRTRSRRNGHIDDGQALVEFALSVPIMLLVLVGIAGFAILFYSWVTIYQASNEGASYAVLHSSASEAEIEDEVRPRMYSLHQGAQNTTVTVERHLDASSNPYSVTIAIDYTVPLPEITIPLVPSSNSVTLLGPIDISATSISYYD